MVITLSSPPRSSAYAVPVAALARWARERLRRTARADGGTVHTFALSGSTCNNIPLEVLTTVEVGVDGRNRSDDLRTGRSRCRVRGNVRGAERRTLVPGRRRRLR